MANFNPNEACTVGLEWFPRYRSAGVLSGDLSTVGMVLTASTADEVAAVWTFLASSPGACVALEVYDITAGLPVLDPVSEFTYYPSSDLYVAPLPYTPGAYGSFNGWNPSLGGAGPFWQALDSTSLTPYTWALSGQPVANDEFVFNFFGQGFDFAVRHAGVSGTQAGRWITRVRSRALCAQYLALGATGAFQIQPYIWVNGLKFTGDKVSVDVSQGPVEVIADWYCNPLNGLPWTPNEIDKFDTGFVGGDTNGLGFVCQPTGSSNNLATILQAQLIVESAPSDPRLAIAPNCIDPQAGWAGWGLLDPADPTNILPFTMVPGNTYLFLFRRGYGTGSVSYAYLDDPSNFVPGPPYWTSRTVQLDPITRRPTQISDDQTSAYAVSLVNLLLVPSVDSQPYMTLSPLDGVDAFPLLNQYLTNSPVNVGLSMEQEFTPITTDEYGWIWALVAQVAAQTDGDLTITVRDRATNTSQGATVIVSDDLAAPRHTWQKIGVRIATPPTLAMGTQYYLHFTSTASADQGWLVQVLDEGNEPTPTGGPTGTFAATWGAGVNNLWLGDPLTEYETKTAVATIATIPETPTGFVAVNLGEECCVDAMVLLWDEWDVPGCGGWAAYEIQRRNPTASILVNSHAQDWKTIAFIDTTPTVVSYEDYEAPNNVEVEYRLRVFRADGAPSDWTDPITGTTGQTCCGLTFTSNVAPELTVFYPDVATGMVVRNFTYPENIQVFQPYDQNGQVVYRELANRYVTFDAKLRIRAGNTACGPGCNNPAGGAGTSVFDPIRAIARAGLPYVCVKNETGDVWFAYVSAKTGDWNQVDGREIDGHNAIYTFDINVLELTDTPNANNAGLAGS